MKKNIKPFVSCVLALSLAVTNSAMINASEVATTYTETQNSILLNSQNPILNSTSFKVDIAEEGDKYLLHDTKRNIYMLESQTDNNRIGSCFTWTTTNPSDSSNDPHLAVLSNVEKTYDFYSKLGWYGFDGQKSAMYVLAQYRPSGTIFANACSDGNVIMFGEGGIKENSSLEVQHYGSDLDIVAHEFTHSVMSAKVGLNKYTRDPKIINEAYADIMGEFIDETPEWQHGTDQFVDNINKNTCIPKQYSDRDIAKSTLKYTDSVFASTEFHKASVVISRAAYLMEQFGISREDNAKIWFTSIGNLTPDAIIPDCRTALVNAALQFARYRTYGEKMDIMYKVKTAFNAVGIMDSTDKIGDVDLNGTVNSADYILLTNYYVGNTNFTAPVQKYLSDINFDNKIDLSDLVLLKSKI